MTRWLALALAASIVVADERTPIPGFFDLPVTGGVPTYEALGLAPEERGLALAFLVRQLYSQTTGNTPSAVTARSLPSILPALDANGAAPPDNGVDPITIAAPLTADHWRDVLQLKPKADLFSALLLNRSVLLVCAGALMTDASVRAVLERDRGLLRWLVKTAPSGFWIASRSLRIKDGRVEVPGGPAFDRVWESLSGASVAKPTDFIRAIASRDGGRLAWFYDTAAGFSPARVSAAFGQNVADQTDRAQVMYAAFRAGDQNWRLEQHPFLRGISDPWIAASQIAVTDRGSVAAPAWKALWEEVFQRSDIPRRSVDVSRVSAVPATLPWFTQQIATASPRERRDRFEMIRFAQHVFGRATESDAVDLLTALGGYRRFRAVLLAVDRMGITAPQTYARIVEAARRVREAPRDERHSIVVFQAALAIVERARLAGSIDVATADSLVLSLAAAVDRDTAPIPAIVQWMTSALAAALPPLAQPDQWSGRTSYESQILQALAGPLHEPNLPVIEWESLKYRVDLASAEHARIKTIREQLASPGLDAALASGQAKPIADALIVLVYAPALGDPAGPAMLGDDITARHDFGLDAPAGALRQDLAWSPPTDQVGSGSPWHVEGSLLGLDVGLARLMMRRISDDDMPIAPSINLNDLLTLARTIPAINARELRDDARDRIVAAIERGRARLAAAGTSLDDLRGLAEEVRMPAAARQTLPWLVSRAPERAAALFGFRDFLWLGKPDLPRDELDRWGVFAEPLTGRVRTEMPESWPWDDFTGRAEGGFMGTQSPDLILRLALETARLKLPARLIPPLLMYATQDYWHDVEARFADDRPAMARQALALSASRVEDYVAALAGEGPLRPQ